MTEYFLTPIGAVVIDWIVWGKFAAIKSKQCKYKISGPRAALMLLMVSWVLVVEAENVSVEYHFPMVGLFGILCATYLAILFRDLQRQPEIELPPRYGQREY
jgi:hypothetical protein